MDVLKPDNYTAEANMTDRSRGAMFRLSLVVLCLVALMVMLCVSLAHADCGTNQQADIDPMEPFAVSVCAHVVGMVCTVDSPMEECQEAAVVARLTEDDEVIIATEGAK